MFRRKTTQVTKVIELSDETKQALTGLENDLQTLAEMLREVMNTGRQILGTLHGEIVDEVGVEPFADDAKLVQDFAEERPATSDRGRVTETDRIRASAFKRRPRYEQIAESRAMLSDGDWHNAWDEARKLAGDEREFRYLRSRIGNAFLDLCDAGEVERRACAVSRSMFEYRQIPGAKKVL